MPFTEKQVKDLQAPLLSTQVKERTQAGRKLSYIEGWHAESEANRIFGYDGWDSETIYERCVSERPRKLSSGADGWSVSYVCKVRVTVRAGGDVIVREGVGAGHGIDSDIGQAHESAIKESATDAEKRALKTFGNPFGLALYDKTQANVQAPPQRKSSAAAKRDGDDVKIKSDIAKCDHDGLRDWHTNFDRYTAHVPLSWLDSIRDMLEHRLEELNSEARAKEGEAELDDAFSGAIGGRSAAGMAGRNGHMEAAE